MFKIVLSSLHGFNEIALKMTQYWFILIQSLALMNYILCILVKEVAVTVNTVQFSSQLTYTFPSGCNTDIEDPTTVAYAEMRQAVIIQVRRNFQCIRHKNVAMQRIQKFGNAYNKLTTLHFHQTCFHPTHFLENDT